MRYFVGIVIILVLISSCDNRRYFESFQEVPNMVWQTNNKLSFTVPIDDTLSSYNFFAGIRNAEDYKFMNLYVFLDIVAPSGKVDKDTIEFILCDRSGKWLGNRAGDFVDHRIWFKSNYKFHAKGEYTFIFEQGMRVNNLNNIADFGLRLEKMSN